MARNYNDKLHVTQWILNVADLILFYYEGDFMSSLSDVIKLMLKHLTLPQDIYTWLNIDNSYFKQRISSDKASNLPKRDVRFILLK